MGKNKKQIKVFCSGSFDLLHQGHIWFLNKCKEYGDILFVSVSPDVNLVMNETHKKYNRKRILTQEERMYIIDNLKVVDVVIIQKDSPPPYNVALDLICNEIDVYVCTKDDPFKKEYKIICKKLDIKFIEIKRYNRSIFNISTSKILERINENSW